jgi:flavin reductase (DIM6/NTAB) family NADH-FMN oxidoreductase RutF
VSTLDPRELRNAFGSFMTGVTVVTAVRKTGEKVGFTANSFTSVSMDPPLLLVCPANKLSSFEVFEQCEHFGVSILAEDQQHASNTFAGSKGDRFAEVAWSEDAFGTPMIEGAVTQFSCSAFQKVPAGDHLMLVGKVEAFTSNEKLGLGYAKGGYFSLGMEHKAEEVALHSAGQVGALIECNDKLLVQKTDKGYTLPVIDMAKGRSSHETLSAFVSKIEPECEVGQVFSVYEKASTGNFVAFYRVESANETQHEQYEYVPFTALSGMQFVSQDLHSMVSRLVSEKQNGVFRLYFGDEAKGDVR